jgi:hypothetical protein
MGEPLGARGRPSEIASLALYLASDESAFVALGPRGGGVSGGAAASELELQ